MERRNILTGMAAAMAGGLAAAGASGASAAAQTAALTAAPAWVPSGKLLVNSDRAREVMDEFGLDGLIVVHPVNVHYLTNLPVVSRFRADYPAFGVFARDPSRPSLLVTSAVQAQDLVASGRQVPEIVSFAGAGNWRDHVDPLRPLPAVDTAHRPATATTAAQALAIALQQCGLDRGKIAVDDMRIAHVLQRADVTDITWVLGENLIRKIRTVKTAPELEIMRIAAQNNATAATNAIKAIVAGMTAADVERCFDSECRTLGSTKVEFLAGLNHGGGKVVPGRPFVIDAVSQFHNYHGDFGRTVVLGQPDRDVIARDRAHRSGRDAVLSIVKPGVRFSQLRRVATTAQIKAGMPKDAISVNPHTVGLEHGDNPARLDVPFHIPEDLKLEENMVLTIDLPYFESGWGSGLHEDLIRVTKTGFETLASSGDPLIVV